MSDQRARLMAFASDTNEKPPILVPGYRFIRKIGRGSYGEVWLAVDDNFAAQDGGGREVAIKFILSHHGRAGRLPDEVQFQANLARGGVRHVVQVFDADAEGEPPYFVMEYLPEGLDRRMKRQPRLSIEEAETIFRRIADGLAHMHNKRIFHCDLKPSNVLLDSEGHPRLADFGQSRSAEGLAGAYGTLFYMSPEQAQPGSLPDARWDVYGLGAILYEMLTDRPPHRDHPQVKAILEAPTDAERLRLYREMIQSSKAPIDHRKTGIDIGLAEIVRRCLHPNPQARFANPQAVIHALDVRAVRRAGRPFKVLGAVAAVLLLTAPAMWFATRGIDKTVDLARRQMITMTESDLRKAALLASERISSELEERWHAMRRVAADPALQDLFIRAANDSEFQQACLDVQAKTAALAAAVKSDAEKSVLKQLEAEKAAANQSLRELPIQLEMQEFLGQTIALHQDLPAANWGLFDADGKKIAMNTDSHDKRGMNSIGDNYSFRDYFNGEKKDYPSDQRFPPHSFPIHRSIVFKGGQTGLLLVALSVPVRSKDSRVLGLLIVMVSLNDFVELIPMEPEDPPEGTLESSRMVFSIVDERADGISGRSFAVYGHHAGAFSQNTGMVYLNPSSGALSRADRVRPWTEKYRDPFGSRKSDPNAYLFDGDWYAASQKSLLDPLPGTGAKMDTGWTALVQQSAELVEQPVKDLRKQLTTIKWSLIGVLIAASVGVLGFVGISQVGQMQRHWNRWLRRRAGLRSETGLQSASQRSAVLRDSQGGWLPDPTAQSTTASIPHELRRTMGASRDMGTFVPGREAPTILPQASEEMDLTQGDQPGPTERAPKVDDPPDQHPNH
jgi:eukaryotic-like serine/threonine-protein kinase